MFHLSNFVNKMVMKRLILLLTITLCSAWFVDGQEQKQGKDPDEQIIVNKKFDDNGNLIEYDSTYVHQWSSDSTFHFSFPDNSFFSEGGFPGLQSFLNEFLNDSSMGNTPFLQPFGFSPFGEDEFFQPFSFGLNDSLPGNLPFEMDSLSQQFRSKGLDSFPRGFVYPDLDEFKKQFFGQFGQIPGFSFDPPELKSDEQKEEWKKLMEKHQKEMEEFRKKWEQNKKDQE